VHFPPSPVAPLSLHAPCYAPEMQPRCMRHSHSSSSSPLIAHECSVPWCTSHWAWLRADDPTECISASRYLRGLCRAVVPASVPSPQRSVVERSVDQCIEGLRWVVPGTKGDKEIKENDLLYSPSFSPRGETGGDLDFQSCWLAWSLDLGTRSWELS
jgi:hypothetical protein